MDFKKEDSVASFMTFMKADEVEDVCTSFRSLLASAALDSIWQTTEGLARFQLVKNAMMELLPFKAKGIFALLSDAVDKRQALRDTSKKDLVLRVQISGAGPVGLRAAVECILLGMKPTVFEKRAVFSRANILTLWDKTLKDLVSLGAKYFYSDLKTNGDNLHMGTREIQLVLLKTALLLGVDVHYGVALTHLVKPTTLFTQWKAVGTQKETIVQSAGALDFKPLKTGDYTATFKCNMIDQSPVDPSFFIEEVKDAESVVVEAFDALLVAEGEWSLTCRKLGVKKTVDRFAQALGLVINLEYDKSNMEEKKLQDFVGSKTWGAWKQGPVGKLHEAGLLVETVEYLKGSTHYIVVTIARDSLLKFGVLLKDAGANSAELLNKDNVSIEGLQIIARLIATTIGLPPTVKLFHTNPVQLFDFSTRARCVSPYVFLHPDQLVLDEPEGVPVFPIGDAQTEPFWPQGLGSNRGFHGAFDAVYACLALNNQDVKAAAKERNFAYACLNAVAWTPAVLTTQDTWTVDPLSRYVPRICEMARKMILEKNLQVPDRVTNMRFAGAF